MPDYWTLKQQAFAELEEKKSRFLAFAVPIEEFETRLAALREEHRKTNHHVTAFRLIHDDDKIEEGAKDDGEPAGTSGMPMLKVLIGRNIINCGVIVVRYFGGTKLGAGGLARAYSGAASMALDAADLQQWQRILSDTVFCRFDQTNDVERRIGQLDLTVESRNYTEHGVDIEMTGPQEEIDAIKSFIKDIEFG